MRSWSSNEVAVKYFSCLSDTPSAAFLRCPSPEIRIAVRAAKQLAVDRILVARIMVSARRSSR